MAIKICLRIASRWTISHAFIFMYVYYCITYGMCHNFNLAAVNIAWTNIKKYTYTQTKLSNLENFIIKFHVIRYYFWVMVHIRIFDKFLPPHFIHTSHITTHTHNPKFHAMDLRWHPFDVLSGSWNSVHFSFFVNNKSFYVGKKNAWLGFSIWKTNQMWFK